MLRRLPRRGRGRRRSRRRVVSTVRGSCPPLPVAGSPALRGVSGQRGRRRPWTPLKGRHERLRPVVAKVCFGEWDGRIAAVSLVTAQCATASDAVARPVRILFERLAIADIAAGRSEVVALSPFLDLPPTPTSNNRP